MVHVKFPLPWLSHQHRCCSMTVGHCWSSIYLLNCSSFPCRPLPVYPTFYSWLADRIEDVEGPFNLIGAGLYEAEMSRLVHQLADSRVLVATLEAQVNMLQQEKAHEESERSLYIQRLEAEVAHLENQAETDMVELMRRQNKIEEEMPALEQQLRTIKDVLHDFDVSEPLYVRMTGKAIL
ncbi:hypothetical protein BDL97_02G125100 [Sphagnum fallax]|nr:hypothetical protein BDL97_02G125100 [Sphagnum fallax]